MKYKYCCEACGAEISANHTVADKPVDWQPPETIECDNCGGQATRIFGCDIGADNGNDQTKVIGKSTSAISNVQFASKGFADADRRLDSETQEIEKLMSEPLTSYDIEAGKQQMAEIEREKGKPIGSISGEREQETVTIRAVDDEEARKHKIAMSQKLGKQLENEMVVGPDEIEKVNQNLRLDLKQGDTVQKTIAKRRGKDVLAEEAKKNRMSR